MGISSFGFGAALVVATVVACSGSTDDSSSQPVTQQTMEAIAATFCAKASECTGDTFIQLAYGTADACKARLLAQVQLDAKSPGFGGTEGSAAACNAALQGTSCADVLNGVSPASCQFTGSLADGTNCTSDGQCTSGSCFIDDAASCGKCGPRVAVGADCTNANCERGLKCNDSKKCTNGQTGAVCAKDSDCRSLKYCRANVCADPLAENAPCVTQAGPNDIPCDLAKALICVPAKLTDKMGTCKKGLTVAAVGATCGLTLSPIGYVGCANGECVGAKCVAHPADGTTCISTDTCAAPAECRNGICSLKDPLLCK